MSKKMGRLLWLVLPAVFFLGYADPDHAFASWAKRYDNNGWSDTGAVWPTDAGGYYLWGTTSDPAEAVNIRKTHLLLAKLTSSGNVQWANRIDSGDFDYFFVSAVSGNHVFLQGWTSPTLTDASDAVWAKFTVNPETGAMTPVFQKAFKGAGADTLSFAGSTDGTFDIGVGTTYAFSGSTEDRDMLIAKLDPDTGTIVWSKVLDHGTQDTVPYLLPLSGGGYLLCASVAGAAGSSNILVAQLGATGTPAWAKVYTGSGTNTATMYAVAGGYLLVGSSVVWDYDPSSGTLSSTYGIFAIKIDGSGAVQWQKKYTSGGMLSAYATYEMPDGSFTVTGNLVDSDASRNKILLLNISSSSGAIVSQKTLGGTGDDYGNFVKTDDGGYYFTGGSTSFSTGDDNEDALFGKFDANFSPLWVKTFGGDKAETATYFQSASTDAYILTGETESFGTTGGEGVSDIFAVTLSATGDYPECYLNDVTLSEATPNVTAADLGWTAQDTTLTVRTPATITLVDISLTITPLALAAADICTGGSEEAGTLSVTPAGGLTASGAQGGTFTPSSAVFTLENTGTEAIDWTVEKTEEWVGLSATSGTLAAGATATVTVSLNSGVNSLDVGAYSDTVTFTNTTNGNGTTTRSVALTVNEAEPGALSVTPADGFTHAGTQGAFTAASKVYTLQNTGTTAITWTAAVGQSWVSLSSSGGTLNGGATTTVTVSLNSAANSLVAGGYTDTVTFTNTTNDSGTTTRDVALTVNPSGQGILSVSTSDSFSSMGTQGGPFGPPSKQYVLQNTGVSPIDWTAGNGKSWLSLSSAGGTLNVGATETVTVSLNEEAKGLAAGTYDDTVTFTNTTNGNGTTARGVSLKVNPTSGKLSVTPSSDFSASGPPGGPFSPGSRVYTLSNTGAGAIDWTAAKTEGWVDISATGGTLGTGATTTVTVSITAEANDLAPAMHFDTVTFTNTSNGIGTTTRAVNLTVQGCLAVIDGQDLESSGTEGGPFAPSDKVFTLTNTGATSVNWSAAKKQKWVKLSKTSGSLAAGASVTVTVSIDAKSAGILADGTHTDTVTFTNKTNGIGNTTRSVTLNVAAVGLNLVSPDIGKAFTVCSYYPSSDDPPIFQWETSGTLKSLELQFYDPALPAKVTKVKAAADQLTQKSIRIAANAWKKILLIPGTDGGTVAWKAVGTKLNKLKEYSEERSFEVAAPEAAGNPQIAPVSKTTPPLPVISWENTCAAKFKVWFYNDAGYYDDPKKSGVKKTSVSLTDADPMDSAGTFSKELTAGQWTAIQKLVGSAIGATIYWHVESSDVVSTKRIAKTGMQQFTLEE